MKSIFNILLKATFLISFLFSLPSFGQGSEWKAPTAADKLINPLADNTSASKKGEKIYKIMCWTCHGESGKGDGPAGEQLNPKPADHTSEQVQNQSDGAIYWKISTGKGLMLSFKNTLSKTQRWQLVNFIRDLDTD